MPETLGKYKVVWGKTKAEALHGAELPLCVYHVRLFFVFLFRDHVDLGEVVRSLLVHEVVDPVRVQEVRAGAPGETRKNTHSTHISEKRKLSLKIYRDSHGIRTVSPRKMLCLSLTESMMLLSLPNM